MAGWPSTRAAAHPLAAVDAPATAGMAQDHPEVVSAVSADIPKCVKVTVTAEYADGSRAVIEGTDLYELEILHSAGPGEELRLKWPSTGNASVTVRIVPASVPVRYREIPAGAS